MNERRVHHRAAFEQTTFLFQHIIDGVHQLGSRLVPLQQATEVEDGRFIRQRVFHEFQPGEPPHRLNLVQGVFHARIGQRIPLLQKVDPQHRFQWHGLTTPTPSFGEIRLNDRQQRVPRHRLFHFGQEFLPPGLFFLGIKRQRGKAGLFYQVTTPSSLGQACHGDLFRDSLRIRNQKYRQKYQNQFLRLVDPNIYTWLCDSFVTNNLTAMQFS
jgi:hypothetical protein